MARLKTDGSLKRLSGSNPSVQPLTSRDLSHQICLGLGRGKCFMLCKPSARFHSFDSFDNPDWPLWGPTSTGEDAAIPIH